MIMVKKSTLLALARCFNKNQSAHRQVIWRSSLLVKQAGRYPQFSRHVVQRERELYTVIFIAPTVSLADVQLFLR